MKLQESRYLKTNLIRVTIGVPGLGIIKEIYNLNDPADCQAWDLNTANGCMTLGIEYIYEDKNLEISLY